MNISINCKVSLSKKLRALLKGGSLILTASNLTDGRGDGVLSLADETLQTITELPEDLKGETSIMLTPVDIATESPSTQTQSHGNIFNSTPQKGRAEAVVDKIAAVHAPEKRDVSKAIKRETPVPQQFEELNNKECRAYITDLQELIDASRIALSTKKSDIDLSEAKDDRERAVLLEMKEKAESIEIPAWIVNDKVGMLTINDLGISLPINEPFDLGNISARKIMASKELKGVLKAGYVRFITPEERDEFAGIIDEKEMISMGLEVYDGHEEAMKKTIHKMQVDIDTSDKKAVKSVRRRDEVDVYENNITDEDTENTINLEVADLDKPMEEESMILNLTKNMPKTKTFSNTSATSSKPTTHGDKPKSSAVKSIKRLEE
jgi:hypothetical protein